MIKNIFLIKIFFIQIFLGNRPQAALRNNNAVQWKGGGHGSDQRVGPGAHLADDDQIRLYQLAHQAFHSPQVKNYIKIN